jgi:hypothetical protein
MKICAITIIVPLLCCLGGASSFSFTASTFPHAASSGARAVVRMTAESVSEDSVATPSIKSIKDLNSSAATLLSSERNAQLLDDALRFNSLAASELLSEINNMRSSGAPQEDIETYIDSLLATVDESSSGALWTRIRPLARFSRRARRASLRRVLELSTPGSEETESVGDDAEADLRRKRRSFVVLLRALAEDVSKKSGTAITQLEKQARREANAKFQTNDMANRVPEGLETPAYSVLASRSGYEIRRYEPFTVCSVAMNKPRPTELSKTDAKISNPQLKGASAFGALAGYLFGKNSESTAMKMTTPVLSVGEGAERYMSFVLPSKFWNGLDMAPKPLENSGVVLEKKGGGDKAAVMFGGFAAKKDVEERTKQLLVGLAKDAEWTAEEGASVTLAQYNDPFTPPWKRRNEVSIEVVRRQPN